VGVGRTGRELGFTGIRSWQQETLGFFEGIAREHGDPRLEMRNFVSSGDSATFGRYEFTLKRSGRRVTLPVGHLFDSGRQVVRYINLVQHRAYLETDALQVAAQSLFPARSLRTAP